jgi:hypothetical protein
MKQQIRVEVLGTRRRVLARGPVGLGWLRLTILAGRLGPRCGTTDQQHGKT